MKKRFLLAAAMMMAMMPAHAIAQPFNLIPLGYQQLTSLSTATALTPISGAREAFIVCTGQTVYWRDDGRNPTTTVGTPLPVNTPFPYVGSLARIQFIEVTPSAVCNVTYYQ